LVFSNPKPNGNGIRQVVLTTYRDAEAYTGFDPVDYLDYYYGGLDKEDMTITEAFYDMLLAHRHELPGHARALIVGNGPLPHEAHTLSMIPEIHEILPADVDARNINIMRMHSGHRNPLATQKIRPGEEHADFQYYLFEKATGADFGFFATREIAAIKTEDPVFIDVSLKHPLAVKGNSPEIKGFKPDLTVVPFCPESITDDRALYDTYIQNISSLVAPHGHLCMMALKNAPFYISGNKRLAALPVNEEVICEVLHQNGFRVTDIVTINAKASAEKRGFSDSMVIWATKI
jgi:hypothetical protein